MQAIRRDGFLYLRLNPTETEVVIEALRLYLARRHGRVRVPGLGDDVRKVPGRKGTS